MTRPSCGGIFSDGFTANFLGSGSLFDEDIHNSTVSPFY